MFVSSLLSTMCNVRWFLVVALTTYLLLFSLSLLKSKSIDSHCCKLQQWWWWWWFSNFQLRFFRTSFCCLFINKELLLVSFRIFVNVVQIICWNDCLQYFVIAIEFISCNSFFCWSFSSLLLSSALYRPLSFQLLFLYRLLPLALNWFFIILWFSKFCSRTVVFAVRLYKQYLLLANKLYLIWPFFCRFLLLYFS